MTKKKGVPLLLIGFFIAAIALSLVLIYGNNTKGNDKKQPVPKTGLNMVTPIPVPEVFKSPAKSGSVTILPWNSDDKFKASMTAAGTPVLLAAYCTVLKDPLPGEEYNVHHAADLLKNYIIKPWQVFSQNDAIGPYSLDRGFKEGPTYIGSKLQKTIGGGVCKIASTLYNVAVLSNLQIVERHLHSMPVPYVPYGQDATVSYGSMDFRFKNDSDSPVLIWAQGIDNTLYIAFYGKAKPDTVEWKHEISNVVPAPRLTRVNSSLPSGTEKVVSEGMDGATVRSWVLIKKQDGSVEKRYMSTSVYEPMAYIIETNK
ncbi:MAG: VanW family protein [Bacillota bacterium]|nr:VanW family protein [Bacillota bacterium]